LLAWYCSASDIIGTSMGWIGMLIGSYLGGTLGHLPGSLIGALLGYKAEDLLRGKRRRINVASLSSGDRSKLFCASAAAMLAKMAKADGVVSRDEIDRVELAFRRLGFTPAARQYAVSVFRRTKNDRHTIYSYARDFAATVPSVEVREFMYEILWDVACSDGKASPEEILILQRIPASLGIRPDWYGYFAARRLRQRTGSAPASRHPLEEAYAALGARASDDVETLKQKYRDLAKKNHPDALRAQGLPEEMIGKATERMSRINAAWATIREARGM